MDKDIALTYDEISLWSSPFGLKLLEKIELKKNLNVLDLGCGTGFPAIEISERLGSNSSIFGVDISSPALARAKYKAKIYGVKNIYFILGSGLKIPFLNETFDLIVSNNGINNTGDEEKTIKECSRVCKKGGNLIFTVNLPETMNNFYSLFKKVLIENHLEKIIDRVSAHIKKHRKSIKEYEIYLSKANFSIVDLEEDEFYFNFLNGTTMINHHFIKFWFLKPWLEILEGFDNYQIFEKLEEELNAFAEKNKYLSLNIPFACFKCKKY